MGKERYLRFGEIPPGGRSVNFIRMSFDQIDSFSYLVGNGEIIEAYEEVPEMAFEVGLSVFEMDEEGMPVLSNLRLINSLLKRMELDDNVYEVFGEEVGRGNDDEPLVLNVRVEKKRLMDKDKLFNAILEQMLLHFSCADYNPEGDIGDGLLHNFCIRRKINMKTGEKRDFYDPDTKGKEWINIPEIEIFTFRGWTFSHPVNSRWAVLGLDPILKEEYCPGITQIMEDSKLK